MLKEIYIQMKNALKTQITGLKEAQEEKATGLQS